jgi:hypothetical protein
MRILNRTAVTVIGAQPFLEWTLSRDADFNKGTLTVVRTKPYGTAYLLPELDDESDVEEWIEDNYSWLFEFQLSTWTQDESAWPPLRDLKTFREWFRTDIHSTVVDVVDEDADEDDL